MGHKNGKGIKIAGFIVTIVVMVFGGGMAWQDIKSDVGTIKTEQDEIKIEKAEAEAKQDEKIDQKVDQEDFNEVKEDVKEMIVKVAKIEVMQDQMDKKLDKILEKVLDED